MKNLILAGSMMAALVGMPQLVAATENQSEEVKPLQSNMLAMAQIEQTLPELSDLELAKVEGQQALVNLGGPGLISVQANVNDAVDVNNNNASVNVVALTGTSGILTVQR